MGTTANKLNKVLETKEAIRTAINNKGGTLTETDTFASYATAIDNIQSGSANEPITITQNGTYTAPDGVGYSPINVNVPSKEEEIKSITITENCTTTVLPTSGKVLSKVDIVTNVPQSIASGTVKNLLDNTKSAMYLFSNYSGTSVDDLISYNDTSNVTNMYHMFAYCTSLTTIPRLDTSSCTSMREMFYNCKSLTTIPQLDTSNVTRMDGMFYECQNLTTIPQLDASKVTDIESMFYECNNLQSIIKLDASSCKNTVNMFYQCRNLTTISQLDTRSSTDMYQMFGGCSNLTTVPQLDTSSCKRLSSMFSGCVRLQTIDITHMKTTSTYYTEGFCQNACSLKKLIIRNMDAIPILNSNAFTNCYHFYGTTNSTYNPQGLKDGRIYVPGNKVELLKVTTNWSVFADIIIPLDLIDGEHISNLYINNNELKLNTPRKAVIYLNEFTNIPIVDITISNESIAQINNINITTEKITFDINALGTEGNATITVNISGDYNKTLTTEVSYTTPMQYTVEEISEATYGFTLNSNEYYESTNKGINNSFSLCKLVFNITEKLKALKLECINSGENGYDFGILSNIDTTLTLSNNEDNTNVYKSFKNQSSTTPIIITYPEATVGEHFIYIKYKKDSSGDNGNDSLQFKVIS